MHLASSSDCTEWWKVRRQDVQARRLYTWIKQLMTLDWLFNLVFVVCLEESGKYHWFKLLQRQSYTSCGFDAGQSKLKLAVLTPRATTSLYSGRRHVCHIACRWSKFIYYTFTIIIALFCFNALYGYQTSTFWLDRPQFQANAHFVYWHFLIFEHQFLE